MKKWMLSSIIGIIAIVAAGFWVLENYVLMGQILYHGSARPTESIPHPTIPIPVPDAAEEIEVYLDSPVDWEVAYSVIDPYGDVVLQDTATIGKLTVTFPAEYEGTYGFRIEVPSGNYYDTSINADVWADDHRLFVGCF